LLAFLTLLVSYKHSTILLICWICAFVNVTGKVTVTGAVILFYFLSIACFFSSSFRW